MTSKDVTLSITIKKTFESEDWTINHKQQQRLVEVLHTLKEEGYHVESISNANAVWLGGHDVLQRLKTHGLLDRPKNVEF